MPKRILNLARRKKRLETPDLIVSKKQNKGHTPGRMEISG